MTTQAELMIRIRASAQEAQEAFRQTSAGLRQIERDTGGVSRAMGVARVDTANLTAQFQDIGVMLAAGQNPLQLALQQGTQISAVLGPMGARGAVSALGAAFMGLLNPVSLITIGSIAAGAAMFQWLTGASDQANDTRDAFERLEDSISAVTAAQRDLTRTPDQLAETYGIGIAQARALLEVERNIARAEARRDLSGAMDQIDAQGFNLQRFTGYDLSARIAEIDRLGAAARAAQERLNEMGATMSGPELRDAAPEIARLNATISAFEVAQTALSDMTGSVAGLREVLALTEPDAVAVAAALASVDEAQTTQEQAEAWGRVREAITAALPIADDMNAEATELLKSVTAAEAAALKLAAIDLASPMGDAAREAAKMATELERALTAAGALENTHPRFGSIVADRRGMGGSQDELADIRTAVDAGILDLIAYAEGTGTPGRANYNETLDYGRWTGGPVDLVNMTLREVRALQDTMRTPENRALYGNGLGSSAVGRYQIVSSTLDGLVSAMGLDWDQQFTPKLQDRMAMQLIRENGGGVGAVRSQWMGFNTGRFNDAMIQQALQGSTIPSVDPEVLAENERAADILERQEEAYQRLIGTLDPLAAAQRALADGQQLVNEMLQAGEIDAADAAVANALLDQRYREQIASIDTLSDSAKRGADAIAGIFLAMGEGADAAKQAVARLLMQIAEAQMIGAFRSVAGAAAPGGFWSMLGGLMSFDGGGDTPDAPRSGGIDGKGGFLAVLHPRETVVDRTRETVRDAAIRLSPDRMLRADMLAALPRLGETPSGSPDRPLAGAEGFTGFVSRDQIAGVVHGGEYVFSAPAVANLGLGALDVLHRKARGFSDGGYVPAMDKLSGPQEAATVLGSAVGESAGGHITMGFDRTAGDLTSVMYDVAGRVVASARHHIIAGAVEATLGRMRETTEGWGG